MDNIKMITKYITQNVSETHDFNNPHEKTASGCFDSEAENTRTQCGVKDNLTDNQRLGETRSLLRIF